LAFEWHLSPLAPAKPDHLNSANYFQSQPSVKEQICGKFALFCPNQKPNNKALHLRLTQNSLYELLSNANAFCEQFEGFIRPKVGILV